MELNIVRILSALEIGMNEKKAVFGSPYTIW
jgi:hypothetical protein